MRRLFILGIILILFGCNDQSNSSYWAIPRVSMAATHLPNLTTEKEPDQRKKRFTEYLLPMIHMLNTQILKKRQLLVEAQHIFDKGKPLPTASLGLISELADQYKVDYSGDISDILFEQLKQRIDVIPPNLVLAQAANESAWGTSRFAQQGNNLFGQWCFKSGCGLVPSARNEGETHEVRRFDSPYSSLKAYMNNLNTNSAYATFRKIRASIRKEGKEIRGQELVKGLLNYSQRGEVYVIALQKLMKANSSIWPDTVTANLNG